MCEILRGNRLGPIEGTLYLVDWSVHGAFVQRTLLKRSTISIGGLVEIAIERKGIRFCRVWNCGWGTSVVTVTDGHH